MNVAHFYHLFARGQWREPLTEHLDALDASGFDGRFHVGVVGTPTQRAQALVELQRRRRPDVVTQADQGWEQVTLRPLHRYTQANSGAVLYAHTKGAHDPSPINVDWRRSMTWHVIGCLKICVKLIEDSYDAVGCHWLTVEEFGDVAGTPQPCFGGNYWLASCDYLRRLPQPSNLCRHDAEGWIGQGNPRVFDLHPGWPGDFRYGDEFIGALRELECVVQRGNEAMSALGAAASDGLLGPQ